MMRKPRNRLKRGVGTYKVSEKCVASVASVAGKMRKRRNLMHRTPVNRAQRPKRRYFCVLKKQRRSSDARGVKRRRTCGVAAVDLHGSDAPQRRISDAGQAAETPVNRAQRRKRRKRRTFSDLLLWRGVERYSAGLWGDVLCGLDKQGMFTKKACVSAAATPPHVQSAGWGFSGW